MTRLEVGHIDCTVVQSAIFDELFAVPCHHTLVRRETVRVENGRGAQQRNVRSVEVAGVQYRVPFESEEDFAIREERVFVEPHFSLDGSGIHNADVESFLDEGVAGAEVVELLEFTRDVS